LGQSADNQGTFSNHRKNGPFSFLLLDLCGQKTNVIGNRVEILENEMTSLMFFLIYEPEKDDRVFNCPSTHGFCSACHRFVNTLEFIITFKL
jgi:hypothetical protein